MRLSACLNTNPAKRLELHANESPYAACHSCSVLIKAQLKIHILFSRILQHNGGVIGMARLFGIQALEFRAPFLEQHGGDGSGQLLALGCEETVILPQGKTARPIGADKAFPVFMNRRAAAGAYADPRDPLRTAPDCPLPAEPRPPARVPCPSFPPERCPRPTRPAQSA